MHPQPLIKRQNKISPLRDVPLRNPGQSLDRAIVDVIDDKVLFHLLLSIFLILFAVQEWIRAYTSAPPQPWLISTVAVAFVAYSAIRLRSTFKHLRALKLARDGERAVGQYLEHLRSGGAQVLHDIPGTDFNIDHVVVARQGVFTIETKRGPNQQLASRTFRFRVEYYGPLQTYQIATRSNKRWRKLTG